MRDYAKGLTVCKARGMIENSGKAGRKWPFQYANLTRSAVIGYADTRIRSE